MNVYKAILAKHRRMEAEFIRGLRISMYKPQEMPLTENEIELLKSALTLIGTIFICAFMLIAGCNQAMAEPISEHFKREEFNQKQDGYQLPLNKVIVDKELIIKLEALRKEIGNKPIHITSGYRSAWYNANKTTGAKYSQHIHGKAADIIVKGMTAKQLEPYAKKVGFTYTETYKHLPHLHVDVRTKKEGA